MLSRWVVDLAYLLQGSQRYRAFKLFVYNLLENDAYRYKRLVDYWIMFLIFLSVYILINQVHHEVSDAWIFFNNYIISLLFLGEYLTRFWIYSDVSKTIIDQYETDLFLHRNFSLLRAFRRVLRIKLGYIFSLSAIIDLLSIMPFFHALRMFRVFILFRVLKLFRYVRSLRRLVSILSSKKFELATLIGFTIVMVMVSTVLIYVMEANAPRSQIRSLFEALYWSIVTIFTVGYGDFVPVTTEGQAVAMIIIISGIAVMAFTTSIIVSAFTENMDKAKEEKFREDITKIDRLYLVCGYSALSHEVIRHLEHHQISVVILDKDRKRILQARQDGYLAFQYDSASLQTYQYININFELQVKAILLLHDTDVANIYTALTLRELTHGVPIHSVVHDLNNRRKFILAKINHIVNIHEVVGMMSKIIAHYPIAFEVINALRAENTSTIMDEIVLDTLMCRRIFGLINDPLFYQRLSILGIYQTLDGKFFFNPKPDFPLTSGDVAIILANRSLIEEFRLRLHRKEKQR